MTETWERITEYWVSAVPEDLCTDGYHWALTVEWRGPGDMWAVCHATRCLGSDGKWDYEPSPSNREDEWKTIHHFPLDEALRLARAAAPTIRINGYTPADLIAKYADPVAEAAEWAEDTDRDKGFTA